MFVFSDDVNHMKMHGEIVRGNVNVIFHQTNFERGYLTQYFIFCFQTYTCIHEIWMHEGVIFFIL